jgi:hypothetical protein
MKMLHEVLLYSLSLSLFVFKYFWEREFVVRNHSKGGQNSVILTFETLFLVLLEVKSLV